MEKRYAGIVACSNGLSILSKSRIDKLIEILEKMGIGVVCSEALYLDGNKSALAKDRASILMGMYKNEKITDIFDVSGGDIANEIIPYLEFDKIRESNAIFWGYSDLTTIINAIYKKTGKASVLYQVRNLLGADYENQQKNFYNAYFGKGLDFFDFPYKFIQGDYMEGEVVGGNIRCLLKLAGTAVMPDLNGKILLLEANSGDANRITTYLAQLRMMGAFRQISGILLGTFTELEQNNDQPYIGDLVRQFGTNFIPIAKTGYIGHADDSKGVLIGSKLKLRAK